MNASTLDRRDGAQFCSSLTASAISQCLCVMVLLRLFHAGPERTRPSTFHAVRNVQVARIIYPVQNSSKPLSDKVGGVTGVHTAHRMALSHPSLPRVASGLEVSWLAELGDWAQSPILTETLHIPTAQPRPIATGALSAVTYHSAQSLGIAPVRVGSFNDALFSSHLDPAGLTSKRHHGVEATELGDGFGTAAGRVLMPVRIISKPVPSYTDAARSRKIEGEVVVDVEFRADGTAHVINVVRALGYGLDEAGIRAVEAIKFKPASINGQAVDFRGRAHVEFHLVP